VKDFDIHCVHWLWSRNLISPIISRETAVTVSSEIAVDKLDLQDSVGMVYMEDIVAEEVLI